MATAEKLMTAEEFLALPDDGVERWLIRGQLWEAGQVTKRNRYHSRVMTCVAYALEHWLRTRPEPRGQVVVGEAGFLLRKNPDSTVGIDVAYVSPEVVAV